MTGLRLFLPGLRKRWKVQRDNRHFVRKVLRDNMTGPEDYHETARLMFRDPIFVIAMLFIPVSVWTGFSGMPFRGESLTVNVIVLTTATVVYAGAVYAWLGGWHRWGVARNIPTVVTQSALYVLAHAVFHLGFGPLVFDADWERPITRFFKVLPAGVLLTAIVSIYHVTRHRERLGKNPALVPIIAPLSTKTVKQIALFSQATYGQLYWMEAESKGTRLVTETGPHFVRRSLAEMTALLEGELGFHCHRKFWVAKSQIDRLGYSKGNPHVTLKDGTTLPVSRAAVPQIKTYLSLNPKENKDA